MMDRMDWIFVEQPVADLEVFVATMAHATYTAGPMPPCPYCGAVAEAILVEDTGKAAGLKYVTVRPCAHYVVATYTTAYSERTAPVR